ncbi:2Fe-2S iron-sulfur cluster binding domain-containing protein [Shewanella sp. SG44-6]|jgi:ferredoxin|uniref:2Fe-2S iron-sulfur cluster-binding protein n=1 Tax=Shewanella sp. SG44-6 TaxID=2760959 RepID=UPI0016026716|nr:2Fe-2S iron-sulfur cluster-binding protein [Shewanella sp. SG44-6]MBB1390806.1 2Fe-2S iron-sulfur cluster binding domain-containing protein [Shewanella sp. SG44-6]
MKAIVPNGIALKDFLPNHHYECRSGFCGQCKCRLVSGTIKLTQQPICELKTNEVLPCISIATSTVIIEY